MRKFFDYEGVFFSFLNKVTECICLSLLWMLFSVPLITIGASSTALYYTVNKTLRHSNGYVWQGFWNSFKSNFKQATGAWVGVLVVFAVFAADFIIFYQSEKYSDLSIALLILMGLVIICAIYLFAHIARFTDGLKKAFRNSIIMLYLNIHWSILLLVIFLIAMLTVLFLPFATFFVPALYTLATSLILEHVFKKHMEK